MWFEGSVLMKDFPARLAELMQTVPYGSSEPMWNMVSSNVGQTLNDDGYVFHSQGTSGRDSIYVGVKNAMTAGSDANPNLNWHLGHRFFIVENYNPSTTTGANGTFNNLLHCGHRYHIVDDWNNSSYSTMVLHYRISITKDRVIITTSNGVALTRNESIRAFTYLGLMKRYSEELDSTASVIATNYDYPSNNYGWIRSLRNKQLVSGGIYTPKYRNFINDAIYKGWGGKFFATHIPLHASAEGYRGELDGVLVTPYHYDLSAQGRNVPENGYVTIEGKEYLSLYKPQYHQNRNNNFDENTVAYAFLIEKK